MKSTLLYFAADVHRNVWIQTTKDLEFAIYIDEQTLDCHLDVVRVEEFSSIREALDRIKRIRKMAIPRRRRIIERDNPQWRDIGVSQGYMARRPDRVAATRVGAQVLWLEEPGEGGDEIGGVAARLPIPLFPRTGRDAKPWPPKFE